jgi:hypothetical protein
MPARKYIIHYLYENKHITFIFYGDVPLNAILLYKARYSLSYYFDSRINVTYFYPEPNEFCFYIEEAFSKNYRISTQLLIFDHFVSNRLVTGGKL